MNLKVKLVLWYFFTSLILLLFFSIGTYLGMRHLLLITLDDELIEKEAEIISSYNVNTKSFEAINHRYYVETELSNFYIVLFNKQNQPIFNTKIADAATFSLPALSKVRTDTSFTAEVKFGKEFYLTNNDNNEAVFRFSGKRILVNGESFGYILIGHSFERLYESMDKLLNVLLFSIGIATLLILILSYFLTGRSLKPVDNLIYQAQKISHRNLAERLDVENPNDEIGRLTNVLNDLLSRLQNAFDKEQEFMADAAHELKTPLTVLRAHWEDELSNKNLPDDFKEKLVKDIETITRLSKLINNLMLLSNTEYHQIRAEFEKIDLSEIINEVVGNTKILAEIKNQTMNIVQLTPLFIDGDKIKIYQLLFNIIDNAIKYTPENGKIIISLKKEENKAAIEIRDNGIGIPEEDLPNILRRFYRVHKDRSKKYGGNGLGLAIVKLITDIHNGEILVESNPDKGTSFIIKLPTSH